METLLELRNIKKRFKDKQVHDGLSFDLKKGEILSLFGGSGTGKSVCLRSIIGLEHPDGGEILFRGQDISKFSEKQLFAVRNHIAYVFQNGALFDAMTVQDNLAYPLIEHTQRTDEEMTD